MQSLSHPQIMGAIVVGFAIVFGAYTLSTFGQPSAQKLVGSPIASAATSSPRTAITVVDSDNDGVEDWRDEFLVADPIILSASTADYVPPDTVTGQVGVNMIEGVIRAKYQGPIARRDRDQVLNDTVAAAVRSTAITLYDTPQITIVPTTDEAIRTYANAAALVITDNDIKNKELEILILEDIIVRGNTARIGELRAIAAMYKAMRDSMLALPVPTLLTKEHLDLLNTYHAIAVDIEGMLQFDTDPAVSLLHLKRYENDVLGMKLALENMYRALLPHAALITVEDPAVIFVYFSPNYQKQN